MSLIDLTVSEAGEKLRRREISSVELTEAVFQRIAAVDDKIHAYLTLAREA
jgi:aspartyl-tRNA(Asn)/glutamyl-tRNA(Gln) amidotransferase subunit A